MGGYFPGRPMEPESEPAKTRKAQAGLYFKQHGLDKERADRPVSELAEGKGHGEDWSPNTTRSTDLEGKDLE